MIPFNCRHSTNLGSDAHHLLGVKPVWDFIQERGYDGSCRVFFSYPRFIPCPYVCNVCNEKGITPCVYTSFLPWMLNPYRIIKGHSKLGIVIAVM